MDFTLSDEQHLLRDTARTLLAKECPTSLVRAHIEDPTVVGPLWDHLREFSALGAGPLTDLCLFATETGSVAAPGPFFANAALFVPLLAALGDERLPAVLAGETSGTVAVAGSRGDWVPNDDVVKCFVPEADRVDWIAVVDAGPTVRVVPAADVAPRLVETIDWSRRLFEVDTAALTVAPQLLHPAALHDVLRRATVTLAAEMVGTARRIFDMTLEYAKERRQFGVPIGSFQAIQHKLANVSLAIERADSATVYAAMTLDDGHPDAPRATHVAKAAAGTAVTRAAKDGIQVHGGIGYTWEHDLHLFLRRAFGSEYWLGTTAWHHDRLADLLFD